MFTPSFSYALGQAGAMAHAYRRVSVETSIVDASPHKLVEMLFDGFMESVSQARGYMRAGEIESKGKAISRAARIVEEGLKAGLNLKDGGRLALDLQSLYAYLTMRLTLANIRNDEKILDECASLIDPLRQAWKAIGPQVHQGVN
ncbi:MAG TPA: flagellar export chaperone FliS [Ideonella sp.]|uniref:flagellar export chaperone FliS n=1 Tax=Ideonella sp. TaxID=1929293 RepID=UPI002BB9B237|nr:flagellar export chaperone FliS [Ideonella sp.]HSI47703.1 flagellar export chaperone FliS [Ideonella sp.]